VWIEPGRSIIADAGVLLTKVISVKHADKKFVITDCAMNDLIRPALYSAYHDIKSLQYSGRKKNTKKQFVCDIVGPVCETSDFLGKDRKLYTQENDILVINMGGAYGFSMSSNYNSRPRSAEVLFDSDKKKFFLVRERETIDDLMAKEKCLK
jgi:diaminopimelate decarboxylase